MNIHAAEMESLARKVWGEPTECHSTRDDLRFGAHGSKSLKVKTGEWFDHEAGEGGGYRELYAKVHGEPPPDPAIVATYDYKDADGALLFQVVRKVPKQFVQRRSDGNGGWIWSIKGIRRVPYRLPELITANASEPVFIVEGEKDVDNLCALGLVATCNAGGAGKWGTQLSEHLRGRHIVVLPDNDQAGRDHAADVRRKLAPHAASVRVLPLPGLPEKGDTTDWLAAGGTAELLLEMSTAVEAEPEEQEHDQREYDGTTTADQERDDGDARPVIQLAAGKLDVLATLAEGALTQSGLPVFQRGRSLVRPIRQEAPASRGRMTIAAGLKELAVPGLLDLFAQAATWKRYDARRKQDVETDPPAQLASIVLSRAGEWRLPAIAGVITTPTLRPDGSILSRAGYDAATRLYVVPDPDLRLPPIAATPSKAEAARALGLVDDLLAGFPFVSPIDRAVALSAMLTPIVRGALSVAPLHAIRATTAGTGKSYLADLASAIATGRPCPVVAAGQNDEETEKRLAALLLAGFPLVSIDNINAELGGDLLCQAIERPLVRIRPLGRSEIVEVESRATLLANGNALRVRGDMTRRTLTSSLDAGMERPELRTFLFDPVAQVLADRGSYVAAPLTVARAYIAAGCPDALPPLASFEDWSTLVRSALVWLGRPDPCASMEAARDDDPELGELREMIGLWRKHLGITDPSAGRDPITARDLVTRAESRTSTFIGEPTEFAMPDLRDALLRIAGERGAISTRRLGNWLRSREGRIAGTLAIKRHGDNRDGVAKWALCSAADSGPAGSAGFAGCL